MKQLADATGKHLAHEWLVYQPEKRLADALLVLEPVEKSADALLVLEPVDQVVTLLAVSSWEQPAFEAVAGPLVLVVLELEAQ